VAPEGEGVVALRRRGEYRTASQAFQGDAVAETLQGFDGTFLLAFLRSVLPAISRASSASVPRGGGG